MSDDVSNESSDEAIPTGKKKTRGRRVLSIFLKSLGAFIGLVFVLLFFVFVVLANLHVDWVREPVLSQVLSTTGIDLHYETLSIEPFSGIRVDGLTVANPGEFAEISPYLLQLGTFNIQWDLGALFAGGFRITGFEIGDLHVALVSNEKGESSLTKILEGLPAGEEKEDEDDEESPPLALSKVLAFRDMPLFELSSLAFHGFQFDQYEVVNGVVAKHTHLSDLGMWAGLSAGEGSMDVNFNLGSPEGAKGTKFSLSEYPGTPKEVSREAIVHLRNAITTPVENGISLDVNINLIHQNFVSDLPSSGNLVGTKMNITFHPEEGRTRFHMEGLDLIDGASTTQLDVDLKDRADGLVDPHLKRLSGRVSADMIMKALPLPLPGIDFKEATADYALTDVRLNLETGEITEGNLVFNVNIDSAEVDMGGQSADLSSGIFAVTTEFTGPMSLNFTTKLHVDSMEVTDASQGMKGALKKFVFELEGNDIEVNSDNPEATTGQIGITVSSEELRATLPELSATVDGLKLSLNTVLTGSPPYAASLAIPIKSIEVLKADGSPMVSLEGLVLKTDVEGVMPDFSQPAKAKVGVSFDSLSFADQGVEARVEDFGLHIDTLVKSLVSADLDLSLPIGSFALKTAEGVNADLKKFSFRVSAKDTHLDAKNPHLSTGTFGLGVVFGALDAKVPGIVIGGENMDLSVDSTLAHGEPIQVSIRTPIGALRVAQNGVTLVNAKDAHFNVELSDLILNMEKPEASDAQVALDLDLFPLKTQVHVTKLGSDVDLDLNLDVANFGVVGAVLPKSVKKSLKVPWRKVALAVKSQVSLKGIEDPANAHITQKTNLSLKGFSVKTPELSFASPRVKLDLASSGRGKVQKLKTDLQIDKLSLNQMNYGEPLRLTIDAKANPHTPVVEAKVSIDAPMGFQFSVDSALRFQKSSKTLSYRNNVFVKNLSFLKTQLPPDIAENIQMDWEAIHLEMENEGRFKGLVTRFKNMEPQLSKNPLKNLSGEHKTRVALRGLDLEAMGSTLRLPALDVDLSVLAKGGEIEADASMSMARLEARPAGARKAYEVDNFLFNAGVSSEGGVEEGLLHLHMNTSIEKLIHNQIEGYDIAKLRFDVKAVVEELNRLTLEQLVFENAAGGTKFSMTGLVDGLNPDRILVDEMGIPGRQNVIFEGKFSQDLGPVKVNAESMTTAGTISLPFKVSSGDMSVFRLVGELEANNLTVEMPGDGIALVDFNGKIPVVEDISVTDAGVELLPGPKKNLYSLKQFSDVQPFLQNDNYISAKRIEFMGQTMSPVAGNLRIERDLFALDQLQIGFRGGNIFGQVVVNYKEGNPKLFFKGNVTGIRPSESKDVLDANATLMLEPSTLKLDGRIQVVRIGQQHLLDMIDVLDPYREDVNLNRARMGLAVGFPKFMRLRMQHGFLAIKIELGGAGAALRLDEIKGIALGPFLNTYVAPALNGGGS